MAWFDCSDCLIVLMFSVSCCYLIICINGSWISLVDSLCSMDALVVVYYSDVLV